MIIHYSCKIVGMNISNIKCDYAASMICIKGTIEYYVLNICYGFDSITRNLNFMFTYIMHANFFEVIYSRSKSNYICNVWSASLKLVWQIIVYCSVFINFLYHIATPNEWLHLVEYFLFGI